MIAIVVIVLLWSVWIMWKLSSSYFLFVYLCLSVDDCRIGKLLFGFGKILSVNYFLFHVTYINIKLMNYPIVTNKAAKLRKVNQF